MNISQRTLKAFVATCVATAVAGSVVVGVSTTVHAREQDQMKVTPEEQVFRLFDPIPQEAPVTLATIPTPDDCRGFDFCDTIPLQIPIPDIAPGDDYKLRFRLEWPEDDFSSLEIYLYDNGQLKRRFGEPEPGGEGYDPRGSPYTRLTGTTSPRTAGWLEVGQPDLVDYNLVVHNFQGQNTGYAIRAEIVVTAFTPPDEKTPPTFAPPVRNTDTTISRPQSQSSKTIDASTSNDGAPTGTVLDDITAFDDPDLAAIQEQNLLRELEAPTGLVARSVGEQAPPEPPAGLTLVIWLVVLPLALGAGGALLLLRQRRVVLAAT